MVGPETRAAMRLGALRDRLDRSLFPAPPRREPTRLTRLEASVLTVAMLTLGTVLALLRLGWSASLLTVWAEDGPIYLQAALTQGFSHAVFSPYAGYLVVVPRLIAELGALAPLEYAPATVSIVSALVAALSGLAVWQASAGHVRDPCLRAELALATVLAATAGQETLDSAAYAPWYMLVGSFWLLFLRPRTIWGACLAGAFLLLTGLSTPGVWFFLPVAALRALAVRDRRDLVLLGSYAAGAVAQVPVVLGQEQGAPLWSSHVWTAFLQRVVDGGIFGQRLGGNLWADLGWPFLIALCALVVAGLAVGLRRSPSSARWFAALAIPTSALIFFVSVYQRTVGPNIFWSPGSSGGTASRYVLVPALLLIGAGVVLVDGARRRRGDCRRGFSWAVAATVGVLLLAIVTSFDMRDPASRGAPYWDDALGHAAAKCLAQEEELAGIATAPAPFGVQIPCREVASFAPARRR
jgi:hypothetical protein